MSRSATFPRRKCGECSIIANGGGRHPPRNYAVLRLGFLLMMAPSESWGASQREISVDDAILMQTLGSDFSTGGTLASDEVATFSPNREQLVVVLRKAILSNNHNRYALYHFS